ncbi:uncharacterized protein LOC132202072 [Neocloeon triangulifer]|uniref:uncharacterized protein LOC132202072 n=1 Tax=Neocloeon triangulifer TaxID=2078957 RepID=UPI00286F7620|nr:uncharacterized protein LOC132202072 [Neocloeon triangulifer]
MWVTRDANQHLICAESAKTGLPFARTVFSAGRVMRSTLLLLLMAFAAAHYDHRSLPELCQLSQPEVRVNEAVMLTLWQQPHKENQPFVANCSVRVIAPAGHLLGIAYLDNQTDQCPIRLDVMHRSATFEGEFRNLCARQNSSHSRLPSMFTEEVSLVVRGDTGDGPEGWPPVGHTVLLTALGMNEVCQDNERYYPCVMMDTPASDVTRHLRFCVPQSVVCDHLLNCPASGADEIGVLCRQQDDKYSPLLVNHQLNLLTEQEHFQHYNNTTPHKDINWFVGASGWTLVVVAAIVVPVVLAAVVILKSRQKSETESQLGLSLSTIEVRPEHEEPPPDYNTIFPSQATPAELPNQLGKNDNEN